MIGIAGTDEKCAWLVDELGIDGAINHRTDDIPSPPAGALPQAVDVFFDNTGGPILDAVLGRLADHASSSAARSPPTTTTTSRPARPTTST